MSDESMANAPSYLFSSGTGLGPSLSYLVSEFSILSFQVCLAELSAVAMLLNTLMYKLEKNPLAGMGYLYVVQYRAPTSR